MLKILLHPKPGKLLEDLVSFRSICLLDTLGKLVESMNVNRVMKRTDS